MMDTTRDELRQILSGWMRFIQTHGDTHNIQKRKSQWAYDQFRKLIEQSPDSELYPAEWLLNDSKGDNMRIDNIKIELEPWMVSDDRILMRIEMIINGRELQAQEIYERDDFECLFDAYFTHLKERIRAAITEENAKK